MNYVSINMQNYVNWIKLISSLKNRFNIHNNAVLANIKLNSFHSKVVKREQLLSFHIFMSLI